ncbi:MAG TPA: tetratricopeptide repeat protein [Telluria sp.]|nr:tetratricopeptide repeat protein [Telluria sp.]
MSVLRSLLAMLAGAFVLAPHLACAQVPAPGQETPPAGDLYERALQSIAEGRKNDASEMLMQVIKDSPNHAGAYLEVALIQCGLGRADEAERLFATIETRFEPLSPGIQEVIANARDSGCSSWKPVTASSLMTGRGYDTNVNQGARNPVYIVEKDGGQVELMPLLEDFLPRGDQYTTLAADFVREVTPNGSVGFLQFMSRRNDTERRFDSNSLYVGMEAPYRFGNWTVRATGIGGLIALGGKLYQRQMQLQGRIGPPLPLPKTMQFSLIGGLTHAQYLALTNFDSTIYEVRGQLTYRGERLYASASAGASYDQARAQRPGGDRRGAALSMMVRVPIAGLATGELAYSGQKWNSSERYAPGLINQVRDQSTHLLRGTLIYPLPNNQSIQLEGRIVHNAENISIFQYNSRLIQLSWHWHSR